MAARKRRIRHDDDTRAKIQAAQLINRLQDCVYGKVTLDSTQVSAAKALLNKVLPDLQNQVIDMEATTRTVTDEPMKPEDWQNEYTSDARH